MSNRPEWILERSSFTSTGALAREILAWLEFSDAKLIIHLRTLREREELDNELESCKTLGRVKVEMIQQDLF